MAIGFAWAVLPGGGLARARSPRARFHPPQTAPAAEAAGLATEQQQVLDRFSELEKKLLRMAELTAATDPHRAALLRKAVAQSKQQGIESAAGPVGRIAGARAVDAGRQEPVRGRAGPEQAFQLLLSEDRSKRLQSEKERIRKYIQRVNQLIKQQKQLQGEAAGEGDMQQIAESQAKLAEKTSELARDLGAEQESEKKQKKPGEAKSSDAKGSDDEKPDGKSADEKSGDNKSGERPKCDWAQNRPGPPMATARKNRASRARGPVATRPPVSKSPMADSPAKKNQATTSRLVRSRRTKNRAMRSQVSRAAQNRPTVRIRQAGPNRRRSQGAKQPPGQGSQGQPGEPADGKAPQGDTQAG